MAFVNQIGDPADSYWPILRARRGELLALRHFDPALAPVLTPILTLEPAGGKRSPLTAYDLTTGLPPGLCLAVDPAALPDVVPARPPPYHLGEVFAERGVPLLPVIRLADSDRWLAGHGAAARQHLGRAVIRFRPPTDSPHPAVTATALGRVWRHTRLDPQQCHLLIDVAEVRCAADVGGAERLLRRVASWVWRYPWASIILAAGAMPPSLAHLPVNAASPVWRWEVVLWRRFADAGFGYGDYAITCPSPGTDDRSEPALCYTADDAWWVYHWSRRGGRGDEHHYQLCRALVGAEHWPSAGAGFSWGDREIARRARHKAGPGTATSWIAWGTSHHLAHVAAQLLSPPGAAGQARCG